MPSTARATFYFDLGSPYAYLTAERLQRVITEPVTWQPVSLGALFKLNGRSSWSLGDAERRAQGIAEVERRAQLYGLPPLRWPDPWPSNYLTAMRAATFAFQRGVGAAFTMRAFRNAFQLGADLGLRERVLTAGQEAGLDAQELDAATNDPVVKQALRAATESAHELGVFGVPTLAVGGELFWGDDRVQEAAARLGATP